MGMRSNSAKKRVLNLANAHSFKKNKILSANNPAAAQELEGPSISSNTGAHYVDIKKKTILIRSALFKKHKKKFHISDIFEAESNDRFIAHKRTIIDLVKNSYCTKCRKTGDVTFQNIDSDCSIEVVCGKCEKLLYTNFPKMYSEKKICEVTSSIAYSCAERGTGYAGYQTITSNLNIKGITPIRYQIYRDVIGQSISDMFFLNVDAIYSCIVSCYEKLDIFPDDEGILDISVSFDGTWMKRGHTSHFAAAVIIEANTGYVVDVEIASKYCHQCVRNEKKELTEVQKNDHERLCHKNFEGKSGAMEKHCAIALWSRSEASHKMRYTTLIGDGDSSAYFAIKALNGGKGPYNDIEVEKEECINHVCKRLGTRLRALKKNVADIVTTKSGKSRKMSKFGGKNKLTDNIINNLQRYYTKAVRDNTNKSVKEMREAILASPMHFSSSDEMPKHDFCPKDSESWCFYNRALANDKIPPSHKNMHLQFSICEEDRGHIFAVYNDLSSDELLKKCMNGRTQNPNEAFHSKIWRYILKTKFCSLPTLKYAAFMAANKHNLGYVNSNIMTLMGFNTSVILKRKLLHDDSERMRQSLSPRKKKRITADQSESDYGAGAF